VSPGLPRSTGPSPAPAYAGLDLGHHGDLPAVVDGDRVLSYAELDQLVRERADHLGSTRRLVVIECANQLEPLVTYLAALRSRHPAMLVPALDAMSPEQQRQWRRVIDGHDPDVALSTGRDGAWMLAEHRAGTRHELHRISPSCWVPPARPAPRRWCGSLRRTSRPTRPRSPAIWSRPTQSGSHFAPDAVRLRPVGDPQPPPGRQKRVAHRCVRGRPGLLRRVRHRRRHDLLRSPRPPAVRYAVDRLACRRSAARVPSSRRRRVAGLHLGPAPRAPPGRPNVSSRRCRAAALGGRRGRRRSTSRGSSGRTGRRPAAGRGTAVPAPGRPS
jgi:hypothetical protein